MVEKVCELHFVARAFLWCDLCVKFRPLSPSSAPSLTRSPNRFEGFIYFALTLSAMNVSSLKTVLLNIDGLHLEHNWRFGRHTIALCAEKTTPTGLDQSVGWCFALINRQKYETAKASAKCISKHNMFSSSETVSSLHWHMRVKLVMEFPDV